MDFALPAAGGFGYFAVSGRYTGSFLILRESFPLLDTLRWRISPAAVFVGRPFGWLDFPPEECAISLFPDHLGHYRSKLQGGVVIMELS